jgi:hypothetical protein
LRNAEKRNKQNRQGENVDARPRKTFFIKALSSPYRKALNQRNKKIERKNKKQNPPGKYFPGYFCWKLETHSICFPCFWKLETPKNAPPKSKIKQSTYALRYVLFLRADAGADARRLSCAVCRQRAPKKKTKKTGVPTYLPFLRFFEIFWSDFRQYFYGVFGLLVQRNGQKRDKKKSMGKDDRKKVFFPQLFSAKSF